MSEILASSTDYSEEMRDAHKMILNRRNQDRSINGPAEWDLTIC